MRRVSFYSLCQLLSCYVVSLLSSFGVNKCTLSYKGNDEEITFSQTIHTPFHICKDTSFLTPTTALETITKAPIPSNLLHKRLGHRSISALGAASEADIWKDSKLQIEKKTFVGIAR